VSFGCLGCFPQRAFLSVLQLSVNERLGWSHFQLFLRLIFITRILLEMKESEPLSFLNVRMLLRVTQLLPLFPQSLGDLSIVDVRLNFNYLLPFIM